MEEAARWAMASGYLDKGPIPNYLASFYLDALSAARPQRVTLIRPPAKSR
jgi:hypothetical protein